MDIKNQIICAAIKTQEGRIFRGHRHHNCFIVAGEVLVAAGHSEEQTRIIVQRSEQGFMDARNQFVSREEALAIQVAADIPSTNPTGYQWQLYSEDVY